MKIRFHWERNGKNTHTDTYDDDVYPSLGDTIIVEGFRGVVVEVEYSYPTKNCIMEVKLN